MVAFADEIQTALAGLTALRLEPMPGDAVGVTWTEGSRARGVVVHEVGELLMIVAGVCREEDTSPRRVLAAAAHLTGGCVALIKRKVVLRHAVPRDRRDAASLRQAVLSISAAARQLRKLVAGVRAEEDAVFLHYET
jgi:hypothetical protein